MQYNIRQATDQAEMIIQWMQILKDYQSILYTLLSHIKKNQYGSVAVTGQQKDAIKFAKDAITYCTSGLVDRNKQTVLSYLQKAIKALNQLRMIEDSLVIYRLSRAPERRIFYIDVGNLPKAKAEQYLREVMSRYRK